jgi:lysophospholipase L1-like esterase
MKKILVVSLILNLILLGFAGYSVLHNGGEIHKDRKAVAEKEKATAQSNDQIQDQPFVPFPLWIGKTTLFEALPDTPGEIIFLGNSITDGCEWAELFNNPSVKNRGIGGDRIKGVLLRLPEITGSQPDKIFIQIGINDLASHMSSSDISRTYQIIIDSIRKASPQTRIYIQSILPTKAYVKNDSVIKLNEKILKLAGDNSLTFIDLYNRFLDQDHSLNMDLSYDGVHLNGKGYLIWKQAVECYVDEP